MRIGVDLGGTKIEAIALDGAGEQLSRIRMPTPRHDYRATLDAVASLVTTIERSTSSRGSVGIAIPGTILAGNGPGEECESTWLNGQRLSEIFLAVLERPVRLANDANCFALSEGNRWCRRRGRRGLRRHPRPGCGGAIVAGNRCSGPQRDCR